MQVFARTETKSPTSDGNGGANGKPGKPRTGFPPFPAAPWESRQKLARFPHSHRSGDEADGKVENQKQVSHFPTANIYSCAERNQEQAAAGSALRRIS